MNIVCFCIGVGVYGWFAWLERQDQLKGTVKVFCTNLAYMPACRLCCKKGLGKWLRENNPHIRWSSNPINRAMKEKNKDGGHNDDAREAIEMTSMPQVLNSEKNSDGMLNNIRKSSLEIKVKTYEIENKTLKERLKFLEEETKNLKNIIESMKYVKKGGM